MSECSPFYPNDEEDKCSEEVPLDEVDAAVAQVIGAMFAT